MQRLAPDSLGAVAAAAEFAALTQPMRAAATRAATRVEEATAEAPAPVLAPKSGCDPVPVPDSGSGSGSGSAAR